LRSYSVFPFFFSAKTHPRLCKLSNSKFIFGFGNASFP